MKNFLRTLGFIALAVGIGFSMIACSDDDNNKVETEPFVVDLSTLKAVTLDSDDKILDETGETVKNKNSFTKKYDDLMLILPAFPGVDFTQYKRVTIRCKYFDENKKEIAQSNTKAMVTMIYDVDKGFRDNQTNMPLKELNVGGPSGTVSTNGGTSINLIKAPGAVLLQNSSEKVKYIEVTEIVFHNRRASDPIPLENWHVEDRWGKWVDNSTNASLEYEVADDGVVTITVDGTADATRWKAQVGYAYMVSAGYKYKYTFEAWTGSGEGNRALTIQYYGDSSNEIYEWENQEISTTRTTYTIDGKVLPKSWSRNIEFQCADKTGKFYVKILSITPY